jgi:hypothetical protein
LPERDYRYRSFRVGGLLGKRNIGHVPVFGFDALRSWQDVATGVEAVTYAAKSVSALNDLDRDVIIGGSLYAGTASPSSLLAMQADAEGSRKSDGKWQGVLVSGRGAWYNSASYYRTEMLSIEFAGTWSPRLPTQLTLSDYTLGLRGFRRAHIGGARRFVARAEERWVINQPIEKADFGIAAFADAGRLWAGDAPFGETTKWQASVGVSLLGAVPRGSRRTFRLDFAVPLTHAGNPARFEVRASVADLTRHFWREPGDMQRAREAGVFPRVLGN